MSRQRQNPDPETRNSSDFDFAAPPSKANPQRQGNVKTRQEALQDPPTRPAAGIKAGPGGGKTRKPSHHTISDPHCQTTPDARHSRHPNFSNSKMNDRPSRTGLAPARQRDPVLYRKSLCLLRAPNSPPDCLSSAQWWRRSRSNPRRRKADHRKASSVPGQARARRRALFGGGDRDRTDDLVLAKHALSQLSYAPPLGSGRLLRPVAPAGLRRPAGRSRRSALAGTLW